MITYASKEVLKICIGAVLVCSFVFTPTLTMAGNTVTTPVLSPAARDALIVSLLQQILVLQAQLLQIQQANSAPVVASLTELKRLLSPMQSYAEIIYTQNNSFAKVCDSVELGKVKRAIGAKGGVLKCTADTRSYVMGVVPKKKATLAYCIDATGYAGEITTAAYTDALRRGTCQADMGEKSVKVSPITEADYTKGAKNAAIQILTYTDLDCPFCKMFHSTLNTIIQDNPQVAVTYRHFPLVQLHPNAEVLALTAECIGRIKGDAAFWQFTDALFNSRAANALTDMTKVPTFVSQVGVTSSDMSRCTSDEAAARAIRDDLSEGLARGVQGTPMSYIMYKGTTEEINGAQPLSAVQQKISSLLE